MNVLRASTVFIAMLAAATAASGASRPRRTAQSGAARAVARFNVDRVALEPVPAEAPAAFGASDADIGPAIGAVHLGGSVIDIPPGSRAWPYHWEAAQEEWLVVLAGTPTVRTPDGEAVLAPGDVVCFPVGPEGAHAVHNAADAGCRVVMLSNRAPVNVVVYPDSGKVGVRTPWVRSNFPEAAAVPYWEGE